MLLRKSSNFHTKELAEFENHVRTNVAGKVRSARIIKGGNGFRINASGMDTFPICYLDSDIETTLDFETLSYIKLVFQTNSETRVTIDGKATDCGARWGSYILSEGQSVTEEHPSGHRHLAVKIDPSEIRRKLAALCGADVSEQVIFGHALDSNQQFVDFVRKPLFAAARQLDASDQVFHSALLSDIKEITLTRLLLFAPHNFSALLNPELAAPGRSQMKKAEEYIASNWSKNLDVIALADAVGVSARTILRYFRQEHGETPRDYMRRIRLDRSRQMLLSGGDGATVVGIALKCGFSSLGHFARSYQRQFGELPSETLRGKS